MLKGKPRNVKARERNSIIAYNAEGKNKTESIYLNNFKTRDLKIESADGNSTDPKNMYNELKKFCIENDISKENDDKMYLFIDSDLLDRTIDDINKIKEDADRFGIEIIISVPTFEIWFLNHFRYSTKQFRNNKSVIDELENYISNYDKGTNYFDILKDRRDEAIKNSEKLCNYHISEGNNLHSNDANPYTDVYRVVSYIKNKNNKN